MANSARIVKKLFRLTVLLIFTLLPSAKSLSQNSTPFDSLSTLNYPSSINDSQKELRYKTPNQYNWTFMLQYNNCHEYYKFSSRNSSQSITFAPDNCNKLGVRMGWRWLVLGWAFGIDKNKPKTDLNFSFYTAFAGIDIYHRKSGENFKLRDISGFKNPVSGNNLVPQQRLFDGMTIEQTGVNIYYIFNNKKFSYPAAYSQATNQRISCGSFIVGGSYSQQSFQMDVTKFDNNIREAMHPSMNFNRIKYKSYSINAGYTYNWVFAKNWLANVSLTPALSYKRSSIKSDENQSFFKNINADLLSRLSLAYNNSHYFAGIFAVMHTYTYRKSALSVTNGFGLINVHSGLYLFKKKEKK